MTTYYLEIVQYKSGLQHSNELSSLKTADTYSTISMIASTGNAPKSTSTQTVRQVVTDEKFTNLVQLSTKEAMDIKSNKNSPKQLTPVTIMVVDTKIKNFAEGLLDSGSTTTMIDRKCLPRNCQTCNISKSRKKAHWQVPTLHQKWWFYAISGYLSLTRTAMWINKKHSYLMQIPADMM
jgi:hypothetical protein